MGVFKKLSGNDVRVTPNDIKYGASYTEGQSTGNSKDLPSGEARY